MTSRKTLATFALIPFLALTVYALIQVGYMGIFTHQFASVAGWQVLVDLVLALMLVLSWLIRDAKKHGRKPWVWVVVTLFTGTIGPLLYLATECSKSEIAA